MDDFAILKRANELENDPRDRRAPGLKNWQFHQVGASRSDIQRLIDEGLIVVAVKSDDRYAPKTLYKLTQKGKDVVWTANMEAEMERVPASSVMDAMDLIIGFDDLKQRIARAIETRRKVNFLLEGPPACGKSLILDAVRAVVQKSYMAFGSRTSGAGLSNILFEVQPSILLMDEADKMNGECYSVLLGLMESGEIIETKSRKTRGIKLDTMVIAACNSSVKFTPEFLSRFGLHAHFPHYTRDEFIDVCHGFLTKKENCPDDIARMIGARIYDYDIGDVRKARGCWQLMDEATEEQVEATVQLMLKYGHNMEITVKRKRVSKNQATLL